MPIMVDESGKQRRVEVVMNPYSTIFYICSNKISLNAGKMRNQISNLKKVQRL